MSLCSRTPSLIETQIQTLNNSASHQEAQSSTGLFTFKNFTFKNSTPIILLLKICYYIMRLGNERQEIRYPNRQYSPGD